MEYARMLFRDTDSALNFVHAAAEEYRSKPRKPELILNGTSVLVPIGFYCRLERIAKKL